MGINTDFAPDADVNVNPLNPVIGTRSFCSDPALVGRAGRRAGRAATRTTPGSSPRAKHFPGHGDTATDSHTGIPVITHTRAAVGADRRAAVPGGDQRAAST